MRSRSSTLLAKARGHPRLFGRPPSPVPGWGCRFGLAAACAAFHLSALAQLKVVPQAEPQRLFAGKARKVVVTVHNSDSKPLEADLRSRLFQTTSATAVLLSDTPWKRLQVLGQQTVIESAPLTLPPIAAPTRFLVHWAEGATNVIGKTELLVYPVGLLKDLKPMLGESPLGVLDPNAQLKPLLKDLGVEIFDLEESGFEDFSGKLLIVGPFQAKAQMRDGLAKQLKHVAEKGGAVVWLMPPPLRPEGLLPSFYTVREGKGAVVVVEASLISDLPENPQAQLNLLQFARLALHPEPARLPFLPTDQ